MNLEQLESQFSLSLPKWYKEFYDRITRTGRTGDSEGIIKFEFDLAVLQELNERVRSYNDWCAQTDDASWPKEYFIVGVEGPLGDFWCIDVSDPIENVYRYEKDSGTFKFSYDTLDEAFNLGA